MGFLEFKYGRNGTLCKISEGLKEQGHAIVFLVPTSCIELLVELSSAPQLRQFHGSGGHLCKCYNDMLHMQVTIYTLICAAHGTVVYPT
jgi:hypothetical protein